MNKTEQDAWALYRLNVPDPVETWADLNPVQQAYWTGCAVDAILRASKPVPWWKRIFRWS